VYVTSEAGPYVPISSASAVVADGGTVDAVVTVGIVDDAIDDSVFHIAVSAAIALMQESAMGATTLVDTDALTVLVT
jgi:hypothetical protein